MIAVATAACEPDYDGTAFLCDATHGCPFADQSCIGGRCRRQAPVLITCGSAACTAPGPGCCGPDEQCCSGVINGDRCIKASDPCPDTAALCDGNADCAANEHCCNGSGDETTCALTCAPEERACDGPQDCPTDAAFCCDQPLVPWGKCANHSC
jgi:hypothetical protein